MRRPDGKRDTGPPRDEEPVEAWRRAWAPVGPPPGWAREPTVTPSASAPEAVELIGTLSSAEVPAVPQAGLARVLAAYRELA